MKELNPDYKVEKDPVPEILRVHFEEALKFARRSVTSTDLNRYENFRKKFDPGFSNNNQQGQGPKFNWPGQSNN